MIFSKIKNFLNKHSSDVKQDYNELEETSYPMYDYSDEDEYDKAYFETCRRMSEIFKEEREKRKQEALMNQSSYWL